jgi:uncharacterized protein YsxB (DUF464 family)
MTNIKLYARKGGDIFGLQVKGHAGFGVRGTDVVCASVSILVINTVNSIQKFTSDKCHEKVNARKATIDFEIDGEVSSESRLLINSMRLGLDNIAAEYPGNVKITVEEV